MLRPSWDPVFFLGTKVHIYQVKQPVLAKLHTMKCNGEPALKDSDDRRVQQSVGAGIVDPLIENIMELYVSVYKVCSRLFFLEFL